MSIERSLGGITFTNEDVSIFVMATLKSAIKLYQHTGMKVNKVYTPTNMKRAAERYTNQKFKRGDWSAMIDALQVKINESR